MRLIIGHYNAEIEKHSASQSIIKKHSLYDVSNDNGSAVIDLATFNNLRVKSTMSEHQTNMDHQRRPHEKPNRREA